MAKAREKVIADLLTKVKEICKVRGPESIGIVHDGGAIPGGQIRPNAIENLHSGEFLIEITEDYMNPLREVMDANNLNDVVFCTITEARDKYFASPDMPTLEAIPDVTAKSLEHNVGLLRELINRFKDEDWIPFVTDDNIEDVTTILFDESRVYNFYPKNGEGYMVVTAGNLAKVTKKNIQDLSYVTYKPSISFPIEGCIFKLKHTHFTLYTFYCYNPLYEDDE